MQQMTLVQPLLERYLEGEIPLYELRGCFYSGSVETPDEADQTLYAMVSIHLAMFTAVAVPARVKRPPTRMLPSPAGVITLT